MGRLHGGTALRALLPCALLACAADSPLAPPPLADLTLPAEDMAVQPADLAPATGDMASCRDYRRGPASPAKRPLIALDREAQLRVVACVGP